MIIWQNFVGVMIVVVRLQLCMCPLCCIHFVSCNSCILASLFLREFLLHYFFCSAFSGENFLVQIMNGFASLEGIWEIQEVEYVLPGSYFRSFVK